MIKHAEFMHKLTCKSHSGVPVIYGEFCFMYVFISNLVLSTKGLSAGYARNARIHCDLFLIMIIIIITGSTRRLC